LFTNKKPFCIIIALTDVTKYTTNKSINKEITNSSPSVYSFSDSQHEPYDPQDATGQTATENQVATVIFGWATKTSMPEHNISNFKNVQKIIFFPASPTAEGKVVFHCSSHILSG
jgi:hypothetical protein